MTDVVVHISGMDCGGILLAQTTDEHGATGRSKRGLIASAAYNGGRVVSYTAAGAVCGALGAVITYTPNIKSMVFTVAGALVMLVFSLGTVPLLFLFGALQSFLPRGWMKYIVKGSAVLVVTLGLSMLVKGIRLFCMCGFNPASGRPRGSSRDGGTVDRWPSRSRPGVRSRPARARSSP